MLALLLMMACSPDGPPGGEPGDSAVPPATPLERHHTLLQTTIQGAVLPTDMGFLEGSAVTFVLDGAAGRVHLLDPHFHHARATRCLGTREWPWWEIDAAQQGDCREEEVELHRGWVAPAAPPVAVTDDEDERALWVVDEQGGLARVPGDPMGENPFDYLRLQEPVTVALDPARLPLPEGRLAVSSDALLLAAGGWRYRFDRQGALLDELEMSGEVTDLLVVDDEPWVATTRALWRGEEELAVEGAIAALAPDGAGGVWASVPEAGRLLRFEPDADAPVETLEVPGLSGALARDPGSGRLYAATDEGIAAWDTEGGSPVGAPEVSGYPAEALYVTESHEILALQGDTLAVASDEGAMAGPAPISLFVVVSLERPNTHTQDYACTAAEGEESLETWSARALDNLPFVEDLPSSCALGIVPELLERLEGCGLLADMTPWWASACEAGPLFHTVHEDCGTDQGCHLEALRAEAESFTAHIPAPCWISGLAPLADDGEEWPDHIRTLGLGDLPMLHIGMDLDPGLSHADPRAKEPYPPEPHRMTAAWRAASTADLAPPGDPEGFLAIYPGDDWPGFTHGDCPNLFLGECTRLSQGGRAYFATEDIQGLDVLVHRAIARRDVGGPASWGFYLPDPGQFDYVADCEVEGGTWSGEDCQAARLQAWLMGLDARFVGNGLATWRFPSELPRP